jgi:hypothetical protein
MESAASVLPIGDLSAASDPIGDCAAIASATALLIRMLDFGAFDADGDGPTRASDPAAGAMVTSEVLTTDGAVPTSVNGPLPGATA